MDFYEKNSIFLCFLLIFENFKKNHKNGCFRRINHFLIFFTFFISLVTIFLKNFFNTFKSCILQKIQLGVRFLNVNFKKLKKTMILHEEQHFYKISKKIVSVMEPKCVKNTPFLDNFNGNFDYF